MDAAASGAASAFQGDSGPRNEFFEGSMDPPSSSESGDDKNVPNGSESANTEDNFGEDALPRDKTSIEDELRQLQELEDTLQDDTAPDVMLGVEILSAGRTAGVAKAHASLKRRNAAALKVFEYAGEKARETYTKRCTELQTEMNADMEQELRRLQTAKDGVSVTSRRRRAVREETRVGFSTPKSSSNGLRRRRTMCTSDGEESGPEDVFYASASPEERAHRVRFQEKKRLERLLGRASIFTPVVRQVTDEEVAEDLEAIRSAVPCGPVSSDLPACSQNDQKLNAKQEGKEKHLKKRKKQKQRKSKINRQRPVVVTPRRIPRMPQTIEGRLVSPTPSSSVDSEASKNHRPRLHYNPRMLQEGQEVEVYRRRQREATKSEMNRESEKEDKCVLSGIITAATETQVYLLTPTGRFESFDVRDCALGLLYVQAADSSSPINSD